MPLRSLSPEQVLLVAEEICTSTGAAITNYAALAPIAALSNPRLHGISLFATVSARDMALRTLITAYPPLDSHNELLAELLIKVLVSRETMRGRTT